MYEHQLSLLTYQAASTGIRPLILRHSTPHVVVLLPAHEPVNNPNHNPDHHHKPDPNRNRKREEWG